MSIIHVCQCLKGQVRGWTRLCSVVPTGRTRDNRPKPVHRKSHFSRRKNFFTRSGDRAQEQISRRGCGVSLIRDTQELHERVPVPCAPEGHCSSRQAGSAVPPGSLSSRTRSGRRDCGCDYSSQRAARRPGAAGRRRRPWVPCARSVGGMRLSVAAAISHGRVYRRFGLSPRSRLDLLRNLVTALVRHERIETPWARADEMRGYAERVSGGTAPGRAGVGGRPRHPDPPPPSSPAASLLTRRLLPPYSSSTTPSGATRTSAPCAWRISG